jgi:hypothetical protein
LQTNGPPPWSTIVPGMHRRLDVADHTSTTGPIRGDGMNRDDTPAARLVLVTHG